MAERPIRVAVVGGGCGAMTAAFELSRPEHRGRYEVTVYQMGWRLGGKGASGRGPSDRIEEHGLHLWMGFYENAFRLMRECYAELDRDPRTCHIATWRDAFEPAPHVAVVDRLGGNDWHPWIAHFPPRGGEPGDPDSLGKPLSVGGYLQQAAVMVMELVRSAVRSGGPDPSRPGDDAEREGEADRRNGRRDGSSVAAAIDELLRYGTLATAAAVTEAARLLSLSLHLLTPGFAPPGFGRMVERLIDAIADAAHRRLDALTSGDLEIRRIWQVVDLVLAILRGSVRHGLAFDPRGFDAINHYDWRQWLAENGAGEASLDSGFMRGIYDLVFAYRGGDARQPSLAAGVALRGALRMFFTCRGALFWRMTAGMGDIVFAPLYEVLVRRGVRFEFFHRLRHVGLSPAAAAQRDDELPHVTRLEFDVQAELAGDVYEPLVDVRGLPCWPSGPDYDQLAGGDDLRRRAVRFESPFETRIAGTKTLQVESDFDLVVLGVPVAALPMVASELIERSPRWAEMVRHTETVATQALQLWMEPSMRQLGWRHPQVNLSGYVTPFDTWADMSHLLSEESWPRPVRSLAYFCSVLPDEYAAGSDDHHDRRMAEVADNARRFLERDVGALWPDAVDDDGFRWQILVAPGDADSAGDEAAHPLERQFFVANVNPSERYTLSLPGSLRHRISPLDLSFDNLTVCGDWTQTGFDSSCVEAAVASGLLAAHALSSEPPLHQIVGYDHP